MVLQLTDEDVIGIQAEIHVQVSVGFLYFVFTDFNMPQTAKQTKKIHVIKKTLSMTIATLCVNKYQLFSSLFFSFFVQDLSQMFHVSSGSTIVWAFGLHMYTLYNN